MKYVIARSLLLAAGFWALSGCDGAIAPAPQGGQYDGFLNHQEVTAVFSQLSPLQFQLALTQAAAGAASSGSGSLAAQTWTFSWSDSGGITLGNPDGSESFSPPQDANGCLASKDGENSLSFCWSDNEIHWSEMGPSGTVISSLDLTRLLSDEIPVLETPQQYSLADLTQRAKSRNFQTVVSFQQVLIAHDNAVNADMNLLPHIDSADVLNILSASIYSELKAVSDLAPFLLPNRWYRTAADNDLLASDRDAWQIMEMDGVSLVESSAYAALRDEAALASIASEREIIVSLRDFLLGKEQAGLVQVGTSDDLTSLVDQVDQSSSDLSTLQSGELTALSQAAGFLNPQAVTAVTPISDPSAPSVSQPIAADLGTSSAIAVSRSAELRQMDDLIAWAQMNKDARYYDWLDPSGDSTGAVGFGLPAYINAAQDQVNEISAQKDEVKATLLADLSNTITQLQQNVSDYSLATQNAAVQQRRVDRLTENLRVGVNFTMSDLVSALQDQMNAQLAEIDAEYGYLLALSRFNRLLYQDTYAPAPGDAPWSASP